MKFSLECSRKEHHFCVTKVLCFQNGEELFNYEHHTPQVPHPHGLKPPQGWGLHHCPGQPFGWRNVSKYPDVQKAGKDFWWSCLSTLQSIPWSVRVKMFTLVTCLVTSLMPHGYPSDKNSEQEVGNHNHFTWRWCDLLGSDQVITFQTRNEMSSLKWEFKWISCISWQVLV